MSQQPQQPGLVQAPINAPIQRVEVDGRVYEIIQVQPQPITPQYQPPQNIQPYPPQRSSVWDDQNTVIWAGLGLVVGTGCLTWLVVKAFAPIPTVAPTSAQPQTVIVQPPAPQPQPYSRRECRASGMFGWGQDCYEERGYQ